MSETETNAGTSAPGATDSSSAGSSDQGRDERGRFTAKEYRYTREDGVPEWAVGRTAAEVATIGDQLWRQSMSTPPQQQQPQRQQSHAPAHGFAQPEAPAGPPSADDWTTDPAGAATRFATYLQQQQAPQLAQLQEQMGWQALSAAELRFPSEFKKWGPDITNKLRQYLPSAGQWTPQAIEAIVGVVRGEHAHELANELAEQRLKEMIAKGQSGLGRSDAGGVTTGATPASTLDFNSEEIPPERRQLMQMAGATPQALDELLRKFYPTLPLDQARKRWYEAAKKGNVLAEYHVKSEVGAGGAADQRRTGVTING